MNFPGQDFRMTPKLLRAYREEYRQYGPEMTRVNHERVEPTGSASVIGAWKSRKLFAVHWREPSGHERLSVNRLEINTATGDWKDGISWEDLMRVKRECGFGDRHCIELYPADANIVNVANLRHLWFVERPPQTW